MKKNIAASTLLAKSHFSAQQALVTKHESGTYDPDFEGIVNQVVDELLSIVQHNTITHVVLCGKKCNQVCHLMSLHPKMPEALALIEESDRDTFTFTSSTNTATALYSIDTDCYPFSQRFS